MKYRELIQFEPIVEVIQLQQANQHEKAQSLVSSYVISDRMMDVIVHQIIPTLNINDNREGKGLFVVGNYGTGKSHLMALISSIAEYQDLLPGVTHPTVANELQSIAGAFKVNRQETSATKLDLRDIVFRNLEKDLESWGIKYKFPEMTKTVSNKELLVDLMKIFKEKYPNQGLLIVVDELLDYLRSRKEQELILDLNFLREVGETCEISDIRFIAGIQVSLFDSPIFQFAADSIHRVKARFEQMRIIREDMAYVISHRLLLKNKDQKEKIKKHLEKHTNLYSSMADRMDEYVDLFPIHPAYLRVFENVTVVEKRELLKAISNQMKDVLDKEVPSDQPGIISFDAYWNILCDDPSNRALPEVREVQEKARVLDEKIHTAPNLKNYRKISNRIINALAVHRLTTGDIRLPLGITALEMKDQLCLWMELPEMDAEFLATSIETVLEEISKAVSGQFISYNRENNQYYIDVDKAIDYDAIIQQKMDTLDENTISRYFFDVIKRGIEMVDTTYVPGFRIWQIEIPWIGKGVTRRGYIFLGAPNERSTAQPERDFYIHILSPFKQNKFKPDGKPDEIYYSFTDLEDSFKNSVTYYSAAREMAAISSGGSREQYDRKADEAMRESMRWLKENLTRVLETTYQAEKHTVPELISKYQIKIQDLPLRDQFFQYSSAILKSHFEKTYPFFPTFSNIDLTSENMASAVESTIRAIAGFSMTKTAISVLEGLQMVELQNGDVAFTIGKSPYAKNIIDKINNISEGKVINRNELLVGSADVEKELKSGMEAELFLVVLLGLVRLGDIVIHLPFGKADPSQIGDAFPWHLDDLRKFISISKPKTIPQQVVDTLFEGFDVPKELYRETNNLEIALHQLQEKLDTDIEICLKSLEVLREGWRFWNELILDEQSSQKLRKQFSEYKEFLSLLQTIKNPGMLRNISIGLGDLKQKLKTRNLLYQFEHIVSQLSEINPFIQYLTEAEISCKSGSQWLANIRDLKSRQLSEIQKAIFEMTNDTFLKLRAGLQNAKENYIAEYIQSHRDIRLDKNGDEVKKELTSDKRWAQMRALAHIGFFSPNELTKVEEKINGLVACPNLQTSDLASRPICPHCGYTPRTDAQKGSASAGINACVDAFDSLYEQWKAALVTNLQNEDAQQNITLLAEKDKTAIQELIASQELPNPVTDRFVNAVRDALQGLERVDIEANELLLALSKPGLPCTLEDFHTRFNNFTGKQVEDKDPKKIRIHLDW